MTVNLLHGRNFLKELDFTPTSSATCSTSPPSSRRPRRAGTNARLSASNIALIFEKTSTRTRCAFEVAAYDQGAHVTYLDPSGSQIGHKESIKDTARVLGRMYDGIEYRGSRRRSSRARPLRRRPGLERPHRRVAPHPDARRHAHHARALRKPLERHRLLLPRRRPQQHGQLAAGHRRAAGHGRADRAPRLLWPDDDPSCARPRSIAESPARASRSPTTSTKASRRRLPLHRRVGVDGRADSRSGTSGSRCCCRTRSTRPDVERPATRT
jgi:ornithine carbamoyltransferase